ncbi:MAG: glycosyltransferase family 4 protein [Euryarchaeota archaeon]|nr:glycosyltransferase family 4 protein [Euryarchaeota archaeon]
MKDKNLLIISHAYPDKDMKHSHRGSFVKYQVDVLSKFFKKVYVVAPQVYGSKMYSEGYTYNNIEVYYPKIFHAPVNFMRKKLGLRFYKAIHKTIQKNNISFDLIHAHFTWPQGEAASFLMKQYKKPMILTVHEDTNWFRKEYHSGENRYINTWKSASAIIRVNQRDIPLLKKINPATYHIVNGYDPAKFFPIPCSEAKKKLGLTQSLRFVFNLAALTEYKGHKYLIEAVSMLPRDILKNTVFVIGGMGPLYKKLNEMIKRYNLQNNIRLLGYVPDHDVPLWMNASEFFVLPSISEGNPTVMFEALGTGKPFIGTAVGGIPEIIVSEDYGFLCPAGNSRCLSDKILKALEKNWNTEKILEYARKYTWENIVKNGIIPVYRKFIDV